MSQNRLTRNEAEAANAVIIGLNACIVTVADDMPRVLVVRRDPVSKARASDGLAFGPFEPEHHRTLEIGLRNLVKEQTQVSLGYVEQLYTFGDRGRHELEPGEGPRVVSVGYLALTRQGADSAGRWRNIYDFFPWENWRKERPAIIDALIRPRLDAWAKLADSQTRNERARLCFGFDGLHWDEEKVLERYEILYEAGVVIEARRDGRTLPSSAPSAEDQTRFGEAMLFDHRRILATGMGRLRGKLKYRPIVFEVMDATFTLLDLQRTVEAISGIRLHKQNFRRLVETSGLVERTGKRTTKAGGRPAEEFRFRREVLRERPAPGVKVPLRRAARL
ncbi:MAG: NAD regulator [Alphaproteobacteria bacterium]|nr:NAD regulator [Alphaproteobacteria bacterium]